MQKQYKVEILPTAWEDLKSIEDFYLLQFGVESAMKVTDQILNSIERLELHPDSGSLTPDKWLNRKGYRMVISERYVSIYRLIEKIVYVYHIADTQTEYTKLFT
ncbi:MAG: type II toxin-antitoxin system RelE/ParE family toxin [Candidatus Ruminococcus intestinipullorum]|nr:type II toxin-antitoxin system RelE/ParE family toxin [Candidatus Ruminococcus intestinipullorum]